MPDSRQDKVSPTEHSPDVVWHQHAVTREDRELRQGHQGAVLWFTGLSGSGKSTLAGAVEQALHHQRINTYLLDGDNTRHGLCSDLGFSADDRRENIRRVSEVSALMVDAGLVVLAAFISPHRAERQAARTKLPQGRFLEVFVDTPLEECERRDPKGLYRKARAGEIRNFTGIDSEYEFPEAPELHLDGRKPLKELVDAVLYALRQRRMIP